ncbi:hypothetical protein B0H11DRAFT_2281813 [Mycena galericulata]|nr:hypothetical protein B0H11DRAFT_2281813 [Mycena galericulata]
MDVTVTLLSVTTTGMSIVPQELIEAILHEIDDADCLKCCSLAASAFRVTSQRRLFRSFVVDNRLVGTNRSRSYNAAYALVTESPHFAKCVIALTIQLSSADTSPAILPSIQRLLSRLKNVRRCTIQGVTGYSSGWACLSPVASPVFDFIRARNLTELHVLYLDRIPPPALALFVSSAPIVSFYEVTVEPDVFPGVPPAASQSKLEQLMIAGQNTGSVYSVLGRPEFTSYTMNIRRLSLRLMLLPRPFSALVSAVSPNIEHIRFDLELDSSNLPASLMFPLLRCVEIPIESNVAGERRLTAGMTHILTAQLPALQDIIITYHVASLRTPFIRRGILKAIDKSMARTNTTARIRWQLAFGSGDDAQTLQHRAEFACFVQRAMPKLRMMGKLAFETCSETGEWAIRQVQHYCFQTDQRASFPEM